MGSDALHRLIAAVSASTSDFTPAAAAALPPAVADARAEADVGPARDALDAALTGAGWCVEGGGPSSAFDARALLSRLKALHFADLQEVGKGAYAVVYKARDRLTGDVITLKRLTAPDGGCDGVPPSALREVSLLASLKHPNIVRLRDVLWDRRRLYLILEYADLDLRALLDAEAAAAAAAPAPRSAPLTPRSPLPSPPPSPPPRGLPLPRVKAYAFQLLAALAHAHSHRVLHRDVKPQNVLVCGGGAGSNADASVIKLADFGLARTFTPPVRPYTHDVVTLWYRAPELLLGAASYSTPVDVWSAGCVLAEMATGAPLFPGDSQVGQLVSIFRVRGTPTEAEWPGVTGLPDWQATWPAWKAGSNDLERVVPQVGPDGASLLTRLLSLDPASRITAADALAHPFFEDVRAAQTAAMERAAAELAACDARGGGGPGGSLRGPPSRRGLPRTLSAPSGGFLAAAAAAAAAPLPRLPRAPPVPPSAAAAAVAAAVDAAAALALSSPPTKPPLAARTPLAPLDAAAAACAPVWR